MLEVVVELGLKVRVAARLGVGGLDRQDQRHQGLGDKAPTINSEMAMFVGPAAEGVRDLHRSLLSSAEMHHRDTEKATGSPSPCVSGD